MQSESSTSSPIALPSSLVWKLLGSLASIIVLLVGGILGFLISEAIRGRDRDRQTDIRIGKVEITIERRLRKAGTNGIEGLSGNGPAVGEAGEGR